MENKNNLKMWASLVVYAIIGLILGYGVAKGALYLYSRQSNVSKSEMMSEEQNKEDENIQTIDALKDVPGYKIYSASYSHTHEGDHKGEISFLMNEKYTAEQGVGTKSRYFYVKDESGSIVANIYASYEGGRGYSAADYINNVIAKAANVNLVNETSNVVYGNNIFSFNTNGKSNWNTFASQDKMWVMVIESKLTNQDKVKSIFDSLIVK
jgi:hypothetical protein